MCQSCRSTDMLRGQHLVLRTEKRSSADECLPDQPSSCSSMTSARAPKTSTSLGVWSRSCCGHSKKGHVRGGCKQPQWGGALHVLTSNGLFMLEKIGQDGTRRINNKSRSEIQPVFGSLSFGTGTPLTCECHSELAKPQKN